jgi:hypothetical protein
VASACEYDNKPPGVIIGGAFLDQLSDCQILMNGSALMEIGTIFFSGPFF